MRTCPHFAFSAALLIAAGAVSYAGTLPVIPMEATGYAIKGKQAAGTHSHEGTAAADPDILPLGTKVRVRGRHGLIGEFVITDTGAHVQGREIDIYFSTRAKARKFGRRRVMVRVLEWGKGPEQAREQASEPLVPPRKSGATPNY